VKLREHPDLIVVWPPTWSSTARGAPPDRYKSILSAVKQIARPNQKVISVQLSTVHVGISWTHSYRLDNPTRLKNFVTLLSGKVGWTIEEIGNLEIDSDFNPV
jgi:hypothetical protein